METWQTIITSLVGSAGLSTILVFVLREWISTRIRKSIEHEYNVKQIKMQAELDGQLEGLRTGYKKVLDENQIRFSRLHAEQADAAKDLYQLLANMESNLKAVVSPLQIVPKDPQAQREFYAKQLKDASESYDACSRRFRAVRIFLPEGVCQEIDKLLEIAKNAYIDYTTYDECPSDLDRNARDERLDLQTNAYKAMKGPFASARKQLEESLRAVLGHTPTVALTPAARPESSPPQESAAEPPA